MSKPREIFNYGIIQFDPLAWENILVKEIMYEKGLI